MKEGNSHKRIFPVKGTDRRNESVEPTTSSDYKIIMRLSIDIAQLTHKQCERGDPAKSGGLPPIRFVPEKPDESEKDNTVTIKMDDHVKKNFKVFESGDTERVIALIQDHESIVADRKLKEEFKAAAALWNVAKTELAACKDAGERSAINKRIEEYKKTRIDAPQTAFDLFEKLLHPCNVPLWRAIVKQECDTKDYVDLKGKRNTNGKARGRVFEALAACYFKVILPVCSQDAAEKHKRYWSWTVKMPDCITVEEFIDRVIQANNALPYLPCMKQQEKSPKDWIQANVKFSMMELCQIVLNALPPPLQLAYWARQGEHFPTDLAEMKASLKYLEVQVAKNKKSLEDLRKSLGNGTGQGNNANNKGNNTSNKGGGTRIPKKGAAGTATPVGTAGGKKHCQNCAKWSAGISHTHNTSECRKWNKDGSEKGKTGYQGNKGNYSNTNQSGDADFKKAFAQQAKEFKSMKKLMMQQTKAFKKSKKRSRRNKDSDSDSSSDSDS